MADKDKEKIDWGEIDWSVVFFCVAAPITIPLTFWLSCQAEDVREEFGKEHSAIVQQIEETSPFRSQGSVSIDELVVPDANAWYRSHTFTRINETDIVYFKNGLFGVRELMLAPDGDQTKEIKLFDGLTVHENQLYAIDLQGNGTHIYWIDHNKKLHSLQNNNGNFEYQGVLADLSEDFGGYEIKKVALGNVNNDGHPDLIYEASVGLGYQVSHYKIAVKYGSEQGFEEGEDVLSTGLDEIEKLVAGDFDGDKDTDIAFILTKDKERILIAENHTVKKENEDGFHDGLTQSLPQDESDFPIMILAGLLMYLL